MDEIGGFCRWVSCNGGDCCVRSVFLCDGGCEIPFGFERDRRECC